MKWATLAHEDESTLNNWVNGTHITQAVDLILAATPFLPLLFVCLILQVQMSCINI
jgi:hypothetical protein